MRRLQLATMATIVCGSDDARRASAAKQSEAKFPGPASAIVLKLSDGDRQARAQRNRWPSAATASSKGKVSDSKAKLAANSACTNAYNSRIRMTKCSRRNGTASSDNDKQSLMMTCRVFDTTICLNDDGR